MPEVRENDLIRAAGAVIWRPGPEAPQILLVHRPRYDDWSYPKGKCRREEHVLATAIREVAEETGLRVMLGRPLQPSSYEVDGRPKQVRYWAATSAQSLSFAPNDEVDEFAWLTTALARKRLSYERDLALLEELESAPLQTAPLILIRHASAGRKAAGRVSDLARPLDVRGASDAELLAGLLASYGQCRVVSSGAERCLATVRPYAAAAGVAVEAERAFTLPADGMDDETLRTAGSRRAAALARSGAPTLICAHRENLPYLIDAAVGALGAGTAGGLAGRMRDGALPLAKSAFLVLQSAGGQLISAERHDVRE
jgi:8-oxo-dGTP diphosphatase